VLEEFVTAAALPKSSQAIADELTAVVHQLRKHQASHQSWLDHFKADPNHTCGRCTPEVLAGVGDAVEQEVSVRVYDGLIERVQAAQTCIRQEEQIRAALDEALRLLQHYGGLLNMHDGGERRVDVFSSIDAWTARLTETGTLTNGSRS
jgi:hypothetical protein